MRALPIVMLVGACVRGPSTTSSTPSTAPDAAAPAAAPMSPFDAAIAEMIGACDPVLAAHESTEPPIVRDRRIDLDGDAVPEAIVHVGCEDLSQWQVLALRGGKAVVLHERLAVSTSFTPLVDPRGNTVIVVEHDCCCMYELEVLVVNGDRLESRFEWSSGCSPQCEDSLGYAASISSADGKLTSIAIPQGECGAQGSAELDLERWVMPEGG